MGVSSFAGEGLRLVQRFRRIVDRVWRGLVHPGCSSYRDLQFQISVSPDFARANELWGLFVTSDRSVCLVAVLERQKSHRGVLRIDRVDDDRGLDLLSLL